MNERDAGVGVGSLFMGFAITIVFVKNIFPAFPLNNWLSVSILSFLGSLFILPKKNMVFTITLSVVVAVLMTILYLFA